MIDEDVLIFTNKETVNFNNSQNDDNKSPTSRSKSNLDFDDCVRFKIFKKGTADIDWNGNRLNRKSIPDHSLVYLTDDEKILDSYDLKEKFESVLGEKKLKESNEFKKKAYDSVRTKLYENRNPNIQNLLKDITKKPVETTIKKLQEEYREKLENSFKTPTSKTTTSSSLSKHGLSRESKRSYISGKLKDSNNDGIDEELNEENIFLTENNNNNNEVEYNKSSTDPSEEKTPADKKFEAISFEAKYKHLFRDSSDISSSKTDSTAELMKNDDETISKTDNSEEIKIKAKKRESKLKLPVEAPVDKEKIAREMRLALFNNVNITNSAFNNLNLKLDEIKQIHLPSFQVEFHQVCQYGDDSQMVKLITEDIDQDVNKKPNGLGRFCVHECCINGNLNMLKGLLPYVDDINKQDNNGQTAAHICALHGELECLKILAANSANLLITDKHGMQLSHLAAKNNHKDIIEFLFQMGVSLKIPSNEGKLPLHYAAQFGSFESLKLLTEYYVDISQVDNDGNYAAHLASMHDKLPCLKYLIKIGTPINASVNKKKEHLHMFVLLHNSVRSLHWLLENGADPTIKDCDGNILTHLACLGGSGEAMNCLLQHDISLTALNNKRETPIDISRTVGKCLHINKAIRNEIRCPGCVKIAIKRRWEQEHEKTVAERTIEKNKDKYYELKHKETNRDFMISSHSKGNRDLIAQYFGPTFQD